MRRLPLVLALLVSAGCREEGPEATYRRFALAAREGDAAEVWSLLAERSREAFDAKARALAARTPGTPATGRELVLGDLAAAAPRIERIVVLRQSADAAVLGVTVEGAPEGAPAEVQLAREGGGWRVVAPAP